MNKNDFKYTLLYKIIFIILILYFLIFAYNAFVSITYKFQIDYAEGTVLYQSKLLSNGENIYKDISEYPFILSPYTPFYQIICAPFIKLFGTSFSYGRIISLLSALAIGYIMYKWIYEKTKKLYISLATALFFLASPYVYNWARLFRVDMLTIFLGIAGLFIVKKYHKDKRVYYSLIFFVLTLYTKQSNIVAPATAVLYLLIKNRKKALIYLIALTSAGLSLLFLINFLSDGNFVKHIFKYHLVDFNFSRILKYFSYLFSRHLFTIGFAIAFIVKKYKENGKLFSILNIYFVISFLFILTTGRIGVSHNVFLDLIISSSMLTGLFFNEILFNNNIKKSNWNTVALGFIIVQLLLFFHFPYMSKETFRTPDSTERKKTEKIFNYIANTNGKVVSHDMGLVALAGKKIYYQSFEYNSLFKVGLYDQKRFLNDFKNQDFKLIVIHSKVSKKSSGSFFSPKITKAIQNNYKIIDTIKITRQNFYIYKPIKIK